MPSAPNASKPTWVASSNKQGLPTTITQTRFNAFWDVQDINFVQELKSVMLSHTVYPDNAEYESAAASAMEHTAIGPAKQDNRALFNACVKKVQMAVAACCWLGWL